MKAKIISFLKTRLPGVQESFLSGVAENLGKTITEEGQIASTFTDSIIDLLKMSASELQKEGDRRATTAVNSFKEKHGIDDDGKKKETKKDEPIEGEPGWFKAYREIQENKQKELENELLSFKKEKERGTIHEQVKTKLKAKNIPEIIYKGRLNEVDKVEKIDEFVATIEGDYTAFQQELAESGVVISKPKGTIETTKEAAIIAERIAEKRNANTTTGNDGLQSKKL